MTHRYWNHFKKILLLLTLFFILATASGLNAAPFHIGEKLTYRIYANKMRVGYQTIELASVEELNGKEVYKLVGRSKTAAFISLFYRLDDRWVIYVDKNTLRPVRVEKDMVEGKKRGFFIYDIDQDNKTVTIHNVDKNVKKTVTAQNDIFDFISMVYHFRKSAFLYARYGNTLTFDFLEHKSVTTVTFKNVGTGKMKDRKLYSRSRFKIMKYKQRGKPDIEFFVSNDIHHLPLKMYVNARLSKRMYIDIEVFLAEFNPGAESQ